MRVKRELSIGEWAVLALLCERPRHGYALAAAMAPDGEIGQIWSLGQPLTYRALSVMQSLGLVEVNATTPGDRAPRRTELRATVRARRLVARWLREPVLRPRDLRSELLLKIAFLRRRRRPLGPLLGQQREILLARLADLDAQLAADPGPLADVIRWRRISADAGLRFVDELLAREPASAAATPVAR
ncbi:PadR family transcriptional regulator [Conexibacter sp. CPCC 206217]|uniref:PadR family transcriptional regulator n=1 Tax=Conexibacter sp. CPCC 206217 TaxID=3064574 RepID=UPI002727232D|nr:PadR family transcriptional regulator [Conexibacter sp. CPCC 206217]MDO8211684.1 PadR family transcriptional regulator [Conexibacter sp. CPCC 206217]